MYLDMEMSVAVLEENFANNIDRAQADIALERDYEFFERELVGWLALYAGKYVLIRNQRKIGFYDDEIVAIAVGKHIFGEEQVFSVHEVALPRMERIATVRSAD